VFYQFLSHLIRDIEPLDLCIKIQQNLTDITHGVGLCASTYITNSLNVRLHKSYFVTPNCYLPIFDDESETWRLIDRVPVIIGVLDKLKDKVSFFVIQVI